MRESTLKGLIHAGLATAAIMEMFTSKSRFRTLLIGACAGWHVSATYHHFAREERPQGTPWKPSESADGGHPAKHTYAKVSERELLHQRDTFHEERHGYRSTDGGYTWVPIGEPTWPAPNTPNHHDHLGAQESHDALPPGRCSE